MAQTTEQIIEKIQEKVDHLHNRKSTDLVANVTEMRAFKLKIATVCLAVAATVTSILSTVGFVPQYPEIFTIGILSVLLGGVIAAVSLSNIIDDDNSRISTNYYPDLTNLLQLLHNAHKSRGQKELLQRLIDSEILLKKNTIKMFKSELRTIRRVDYSTDMAIILLVIGIYCFISQYIFGEMYAYGVAIIAVFAFWKLFRNHRLIKESNAAYESFLNINIENARDEINILEARR